MFDGPPNPAPAAFREALAVVLHRSLVFIRNFSAADDFPHEQKVQILSDLGDALHNVPIVMERYHKGHDADYLITLLFRGFNQKWSTVPEVLRLEVIYTSTLEAIAKRWAGRQHCSPPN